jgi:spore coat protein U-like protein
MGHGTHGRRVSVPSGLPRELRDSSHGGESRRSPEAAGDASSAYTTKSSQKEGRMMRGIKVLVVVGLVVGLVVVLGLNFTVVVALAQQPQPPPLPFNAVKITCTLNATVIGLNIFGNIRSAEGRDFETTIATASGIPGGQIDVPCRPGQPVTWSLAAGTLRNVAPRIGGAITKLTGANLVYACVPPPPRQNQVKDVTVTGGPPWRFPCSPDEIIVEVEGGPVPTLTEWGLIALAVLLAGSLAFMIRRRLAPRPAGA